MPGRGGRYTVRVMENGTPVDRPIEIGANNRVTAEIRTGLKVGDEIVLDGARTPGAGGNRPPGGLGGGAPRL